jgi:hypothetical protein
MMMSQVSQPCSTCVRRLLILAEWDGSDDAFSSSEVMESVTELGAVADLNDPENQL